MFGSGNFERRMDEEKDVGLDARIVVENGIWQRGRGRMRNEKGEETKGEYALKSLVFSLLTRFDTHVGHICVERGWQGNLDSELGIC